LKTNDKTASKKNIKKYLGSLILVLLIVWYLNTNWAQFIQLKLSNPEFLLPSFVLCIAITFSQSLYNYFALKHFNANIGIKDCLFLAAQSFIGNLIAPMRAGTVANAYYLKKMRNVDYTTFGIINIALYVIVFGINSIIGAAILYFYFGLQNSEFVAIFSVFIALFFACTIFFTLPWQWSSTLKLPNLLRSALSGVSKLKQSHVLLIGYTLPTLLNLFLMSLLSYFLLKSLGIDSTYPQMIFVTIFSSLSLFISITPGNLGIREAFAALSAQLAGIDPHQMIAASILERAIMLVACILIYFLTKHSWESKPIL